MANKPLQLTEELYSYYQQHSVRDLPCLKALREDTAARPGAQMQISPEYGQFLQFMVVLLKADRILELGTFTGYSALCMALAQSDKGKVITCDIDEKITAVAKTHWQQAGVADKIQPMIGPALESMNQLHRQQAQFDLIFIDADKRHVVTYYELAYQCLAENGVIIIDNVFLNGKVIDPKQSDPQTLAMRQLNDFLLKDDRITLSMLPLNDGLTLITKN